MNVKILPLTTAEFKAKLTAVRASFSKMSKKDLATLLAHARTELPGVAGHWADALYYANHHYGTKADMVNALVNNEMFGDTPLWNTMTVTSDWGGTVPAGWTVL